MHGDPPADDRPMPDDPDTSTDHPPYAESGRGTGPTPGPETLARPIRATPAPVAAVGPGPSSRRVGLRPQGRGRHGARIRRTGSGGARAAGYVYRQARRASHAEGAGESGLPD